MTLGKHGFRSNARGVNSGRLVIILAVGLLVFCRNVNAISMPMISALLYGSMAADTEENSNLEYQLKAAFLYNFMKFIEWAEMPSGAGKEEKYDKKPVILTVLGEDMFGNHLDDLTKKLIKDRPVRIVRLEGYEQYKKTYPKVTLEQYLQVQRKAIESSHLFFVSKSEGKWIDAILTFTDTMRIITVSDVEGFAVKGGVIGFVMEENKIRFDINTFSAEKKKLKVSSQLLQLARKVYKQ